MRVTKKKYFESLAGLPDQKIHLAEAALHIAADEYPGLDIPSYLNLLAAWSRKLNKKFSESPPEIQLQELNEWLFTQMRFCGNLEDYYDPKNSFLNEVIDRRKGIPISLSIIYLELAWSMGLKASGIGFPGHFLVRVMTDERPLYVDTFHKGNIMTGQDCMNFLEELTEGEVEFEDSFLHTVGKRQILTRMLRNLKKIYLEQTNFSKLVGITDKLVALCPEDPEEIRDRGIVHYQRKSYQLALQDFETYLSMAPDAEDAHVIQQYLQILSDYRVHLN